MTDANRVSDDREQTEGTVEAARRTIRGQDGSVHIDPLGNGCDLSVVSTRGDCPSAAVVLSRDQANDVAAALRSRGSTECDGSDLCQAPIHMHGCFSDKGDCDHPSEHKRGSSDTRLTETLADKTGDYIAIALNNLRGVSGSNLSVDNAIRVLDYALTALAAARADAPQEEQA